MKIKQKIKNKFTEKQIEKISSIFFISGILIIAICTYLSYNEFYR